MKNIQKFHFFFAWFTCHVPKIKQNQFDLFVQSNKEIEYTHIGEITSENELKLLDQGNDYSLTGNPYSHF